jgi:hypothetical protein
MFLAGLAGGGSLTSDCVAFQALPEPELQGGVRVVPAGGRAVGVWRLPPPEAHHCESPNPKAA